MEIVRLASYALRGAVAVMVGALALKLNVDVGCQRDIMNVLLPCAPATMDDLRKRISSAPADIWAYKDYALSSREPDRTRLVPHAALLYPQEPNLQWASAVIAAKKGDADRATGLLVNIVEHSGDGTAADALAKLALAGGSGLLIAHLGDGSRWADRLASYLPTVPGALRAGVPFVAEAARKGAITRERALQLVDAYKTQAAYVEAFSLWAQLQDSPVPLLRNGDFAEPINSTPFDWETKRGSKSGVSARVFRGENIPFVELSLDGRSVMTPMLRQLVFAPPGKYRVEGQYRERLRAYAPPSWIVGCTGQSTPLLAIPLAPSSDWQTFSGVFEVPPECRELVSLSATFPDENAATVAGMGTLAFRSIRLTPLN